MPSPARTGDGFDIIYVLIHLNNIIFVWIMFFLYFDYINSIITYI